MSSVMLRLISVVCSVFQFSLVRLLVSQVCIVSSVCLLRINIVVVIVDVNFDSVILYNVMCSGVVLLCLVEVSVIMLLNSSFVLQVVVSGCLMGKVLRDRFSVEVVIIVSEVLVLRLRICGLLSGLWIIVCSSSLVMLSVVLVSSVVVSCIRCRLMIICCLKLCGLYFSSVCSIVCGVIQWVFKLRCISEVVISSSVSRSSVSWGWG